MQFPSGTHILKKKTGNTTSYEDQISVASDTISSYSGEQDVYEVVLPVQAN